MNDEMGLSTVLEFENRLKELQKQFAGEAVPKVPTNPSDDFKHRHNTSMMSQMSTNYATPVPRGSAQPIKTVKTDNVDDQVFLDMFSNRIQKVVQHCKDESDMLRHEAERIAQELGIPIRKLVALESVVEREDFVIKTLQTQVHEQLQDMKDRQTKYPQPVAETEEGIYDWLEVQSKFVSLKERLKFALVESINDRQNQQYLTKYFASRKANNSYTRAQIPSYPQPDTRSIIDELTNLLKIVKQKRGQSEIQQKQQEPDPKIVEKLKQVLRWDQDKETAFKSRRQSAKERLSKLVKTSSWNQVGCAELVRVGQKHTRSTLQREDLLGKYHEGEMLNAQEYQYLANTSDLLNKCCDRKYIQSAVNLIDEDIINDIELYIAENILKSFYNTLKLTQQQRLQWLSRRTEAIKSQNHSRSLSVKSPICTKIEQMQRVKQKLVAMLKSIKRAKQEETKVKAKHMQFLHKEMKEGNVYANPFVWKFKEKMMAVVQRHRKKSNQQLSKEFLQRQRNLYQSEKVLFVTKNDTFTAQQCKRSFHPGSKLLIKPDNNIEDKPGRRRKGHSEEIREMEAYKLPANAPNTSPQNFQFFYTGGPIRPRPFASPILNTLVLDEDVPQNGPFKGGWITAEIEVAAANKIKSAIRGYIQRKQYNKMLERKNLAKQRMVEQKVKKYLESKALFEYLSVSKQHTPNQVGTNMSTQFVKFKSKLRKSAKVSQRQYHRTTTDPKPKKQQYTPIDPSKIRIPISMQDLPLKQKKLFYSLKQNSLQLIEHSGFLYTPMDVNCYDVEGNTPLYYAALNGNTAFCAFLLTNGADVNLPSKHGNIPLHAAFVSNNVVLITLLIQNNANLNEINHQGQTPIHLGTDSTLKELNLAMLVATRTQQAETDNNAIHKSESLKVDEFWQTGGDFKNDPIQRSDILGPPGRPKSYHPPNQR